MYGKISRKQADAVYREVMRTAAVRASMKGMPPSGKFVLRTLIKQFSRMLRKEDLIDIASK
ncbi:MAG: hypothetical protein JW807_00760 [Spirochaetes bacterium]|nr:hypothetical protein [Spirochaetota bacterium]